MGFYLVLAFGGPVLDLLMSLVTFIGILGSLPLPGLGMFDTLRTLFTPDNTYRGFSEIHIFHVDV